LRITTGFFCLFLIISSERQGGGEIKIGFDRIKLLFLVLMSSYLACNVCTGMEASIDVDITSVAEIVVKMINETARAEEDEGNQLPEPHGTQETLEPTPSIT
jgi:hypothetical protein